mgnify:CR=1 FL=1
MEQIKQMINRIIDHEVGMQNTWYIKFPSIATESRMKLNIDNVFELKKDFTADTNLLSKNLFIIVDVLTQIYRQPTIFPNIYLTVKNVDKLPNFKIPNYSIL